MRAKSACVDVTGRPRTGGSKQDDGQSGAVGADVGFKRVKLDTNRTLVEAQAMYRKRGYRDIAPYNDNPYAHHWFEKAL